MYVHIQTNYVDTRTLHLYVMVEHDLQKHSLCVVVDGVVANKQRGVESFSQQ